MSDYSKEFLLKAITTRYQLSSSVLSHEDVREITENITGLFALLSGWEKKDGGKNENNKEKK